MKSMLAHTMIFSLALIFTIQVHGQGDIFKGLIDKEDPVFESHVLPSDEEGQVKLVVYFTHSKLDALEYSVWLKDQGTNFQADGEKMLARGLSEIGNRQQDTILINGLQDYHIYTFGIDYRKGKGLSRKFTEEVLEASYRYSQPRVAKQAAKTPVEKAIINNQPLAKPCISPEVEVRVDPTGYCGQENRPAIMVQCLNCQGDSWSFSVETKQGFGNWQPLRADGQRQDAIGAALRTEPLCRLTPGEYQVRVMAWGENCTTPVINNFATKIIIPDHSQPDAFAEQITMEEKTVKAPASPTLPDECGATGHATLVGDMISGILEFSKYSPCADYHPFAEIRYVHPGYRDIPLQSLRLIPGGKTPFNVQIDEKDLARGIHTLQVVIYVAPGNGLEAVANESFWIRVKSPEERALASNPKESPYSESEVTPVQPPQAFNWNDERIASRGSSQAEEQQGWSSYPGSYGDPVVPVNNDNTTASRGGADDFGAYSIDESLMEETISEVQVTASDPNCTQIQDLQLGFGTNDPSSPLFISWLNPRCCQESGCEYTVWAGKTPEQLRLLVSGKKPGAIINELVGGMVQDDQYFEVVVKTGNGVRKAAYVMGEGPKYGIEEILDYRDRLKPPTEGQIVAVKGKGFVNPNDANNPEAFDYADVLNYDAPKLEVQEFKPCKYKREIEVIGDKPILEGDEIKIKYNFSDKEYQYTLYQYVQTADAWVLAPGTEELQEKPEFVLEAEMYHTGKYLILIYNPKKGWGCLSSAPEEPLEIDVTK